MLEVLFKFSFTILFIKTSPSKYRRKRMNELFSVYNLIDIKNRYEPITKFIFY